MQVRAARQINLVNVQCEHLACIVATPAVAIVQAVPKFGGRVVHRDCHHCTWRTPDVAGGRVAALAGFPTVYRSNSPRETLRPLWLAPDNAALIAIATVATDKQNRSCHRLDDGIDILLACRVQAAVAAPIDFSDFLPLLPVVVAPEDESAGENDVEPRLRFDPCERVDAHLVRIASDSRIEVGGVDRAERSGQIDEFDGLRIHRAQASCTAGSMTTSTIATAR